MAIVLNKAIGAIDLVPNWLDIKGKITNIRGFSHVAVISGILGILAKYSPNSHLYIAGIGSIIGVPSDNYSDSGITYAVLDGLVQQVNDAIQSSDALASGVTRPKLVRGLYNLVAASQDLTNNVYGRWQTAGYTVTTGISDPFGGTSAVRVTCSSAFNEIRQPSAYAVVSGTLYTTAVWVRRYSGSGTVQLAHAQVFQTITLTSSWQLVTVQGTDTDNVAITSIRMFTAGDSMELYSFGTFRGAWTSEEIIAMGGIPTTQNAQGSNTSAGPYSWYFDGVDDSLVRTFPAGYESSTIINATYKGQTTLTAQNIVGNYPITSNTCGQIIIAPSVSITTEDLASLQGYANNLAGV